MVKDGIAMENCPFSGCSAAGIGSVWDIGPLGTPDGTIGATPKARQPA
jgi:hypothetical protein